MADKEKIMHELVLLIQREKLKVSCSCDGYDIDLLEAVFSLLKEQESKVEIEGGGSTWCYVCGECHTSVSPYAKYCRECGRRLIWDGRH